jgi:hypothetical protein
VPRRLEHVAHVRELVSIARFIGPAPYQTISGGRAAIRVATRLAMLANPGYSITTSIPVSFLKSALILS